MTEHRHGHDGRVGQALILRRPLRPAQAHKSAVSDAEAFTCGCVLEVLFSTQP